MGYLMIDNRAAGEALEEYNTVTCGHNNEMIVYASKPIGGFLRKVRTSIDKYGRRVEEVGQGYFCQRCNKDLCWWCGNQAFKSNNTGLCRTMERQADATATAINHHIDIWSKSGQLYIENLVSRKLF